MKKRRFKTDDIEPDEIFLDSTNLSGFDMDQLEGHFERPLSSRAMKFFGGVALICITLLFYQVGRLQIARGQEFYNRSERNTLRHIPVFAERGLIYDRNGQLLAWNDESGRSYYKNSGLSHILGYIGLPTEEELSSHYSEELLGREGSERSYNDVLSGVAGTKVVETDASGKIVSEGIVQLPTVGSNITLTIDARIQEKLYSIIEQTAAERGFQGGAGIILDIQNGGLLAVTSFPEYSSEVMSKAEDREQIAAYNSDSRKPFLHRAIAGVYTPGSIIKPFVGLSALTEKIITPEKNLYSKGYIDVPNPYNPDDYMRFNDWKAHGYVDLRHAIAVSSNVYFYEIGGGFEEQKGLGITKLMDYLSLFGFGQSTGVALLGEAKGLIPTPAWKAEAFDGDDWRIGDTYFTSIGQFGFGVTALQMARAVGALASYGSLLTPRIVEQVSDAQTTRLSGILDTFATASGVSSTEKTELPFSVDDIQVIQDGMRLSVMEGTAKGLDVAHTNIAAKTGTAELGVSKAKVNSWVVGFWPYEKPRYAFAVVMENGSVKNTIGGVYVMRTLVDWMNINYPEYLHPQDYTIPN
ncbi:MAG: penicillin-binding transpeptidase domain-containing protein [bacterium]|nr:penicillin-binding transpeptidase domain-containing protein [bacterium]